MARGRGALTFQSHAIATLYDHRHATENKSACNCAPALLMDLERAAARERVTVDVILADAIGRHLWRRELDDVLAFGKRHASARGLTPGDVVEAIAGER